MKKAKIIAAAVGALLILIVMAQNTAAVETKFLFISATMPRAILLMLTFGIGVVVGLLIAFTMSGGKTPKIPKVSEKTQD